MKADNESAISIPVYFKPVKKWTYILRKKKKNQKDKKKKGKKTSYSESRTQEPSTRWVYAFSAKLINFNS